MKLTVALEHRFTRTPDGAVWTRTFFGPTFWDRYLGVFDAVDIVARVCDVGSTETAWQRVDSRRVRVRAVPNYMGPWQFLARASQVRKAARDTVNDAEAVILRVSSTVAACLEPALRRRKRPYGVEVVADPYDALAPGAVKHPLRPLLRWWFPRQLRGLCSRAAAASYVTQAALQRRYPPSKGAYTTNYSSVELGPQSFCQEPRSYTDAHRPHRLVFVGTLAELYKAPDVLLDGFALCIRNGLDVTLNLVGGGRMRAVLEARARALNVTERVRFVGELSSGEAVREQLDQAGLFVLPSRQEGLPRAMIEAMARALPCIGSSVGGIPELLGTEEIVPPGSASALAEKIGQLLSDPARMTKLSARNLAKAQDYREEILNERRLRFYRELRSRTEAWLSKRTMQAVTLTPTVAKESCEAQR